MKKEEETEKKKDWEKIMSKINELNLPEKEASKIKEEILHKEGENLRKQRQKISIFDFEPLKIIGKGAFGEVRVCRYTPTGDIIAIKKMKKEEMHRKKQILHVRAEKDVLSEAKNPWIVDLKFSFQDPKFLYLGMEFLPGGDLMSLLMEKDILPEQDAKFYAAELVLSIENVHKLNCIHRDLKPDNILIDKHGHIKLSDFGLSKKIDFKMYEDVINNANNTNSGAKNNTNSYAMQFNQFKKLNKKKRRAYAFSTVGTPDYIAPEVFTREGYGPEVDWWSLGIIMFEMMIGYPPFFSDTSKETCNKILHWKDYLAIPPEANISKEAIDILKELITDVNKRLGYKGADEIKKHPFFKGIDWENIKETMTPPFVPELISDYDTRYFENFEEDEPFYPSDESLYEYKNKNVNKDMCFIDFTYKRDDDNYRKGMVSALEVFDSLKDNINNIEKERMESFADNNMIQEPVNSIQCNDINQQEKESIAKKEAPINKNIVNTDNNIQKSKPKETYINCIKSNNDVVVDKKKNVFQPKTKISSNNTKTSHYVQISLNHNTNKSNNSKPKGIGIKQDGIFSQRTTMKKDRNEFMVNVPKGNQKIVFPSSAMNSNKIHSNHIAIASKKEEITPFTTKTKKVNLDSAFGHQTKDTNGYKFLKVKETNNHFVTKLKK